MRAVKKVLMGVAALAALGFGGAAIAGAAGQAAVKDAGGGTVKSVEISDEKGAKYEVKVVLPSGEMREINLDDSLAVTSNVREGQPAEGETNDD